MSEHIASNGRIALTTTELNYLQSLLTAGDRSGFYMAYYNMTGSEQAILQAQISSFSEGPGGAAYAANAILQSYFGPQGKYLGIYAISQLVAQSAMDAIKREVLEEHGDGLIDATTMLASAADAWNNLGQGNQFPGNLLEWPLHAQQITSTEVDEQSLWEGFCEILSNLGDPQAIADELLSTGTAVNLASSVLGSRLLGKRRSDYEGNAAYQIVETPDGEWASVIRLSDGKTVAVLEDDPFQIDSVVEFAGAAAEVLSVGILSQLIPNFSLLDQALSILRVALTEHTPGFDGELYAHAENPPFTAMPTPLHSAPSAGNDTLWGTDGFGGLIGANDTIDAAGGNDVVFGGDGRDAISGEAGNDVLYGQLGDDSLYGGDGADVLRGGAGNDVVDGGIGDDTLDGGDNNPDAPSGDDELRGGDGDDTLRGGDGNDVLEGGMGNDTYAFSINQPGTDDEQDVVRDTDGMGRLVLNGIELVGHSARAFVHPRFSQNPAWYLEVDGKGLELVLLNRDAATGRGTLRIDIVGSDQRILVENFRPGDLGLDLSLETILMLTPDSSGAINPFSDFGFVPVKLNTELLEGGARTVSVSLNRPAQALATIRLSVSDLDEYLRIIDGAETLSFTDGHIDLALSEGQTTATFSLLSLGDVDISKGITLTAVLLGQDGQPMSASADMDINFDAVAEPGAPAPQTDHVIVGTAAGENVFALHPVNPAGNYNVQGFGGDDLMIASEIIRGTNDPLGNDVLDGGDGNDNIDGWLGDDWVIGGAGIDILYGGEGTDVLEGGSGSDTGDGGLGDDLVFAENQIDQQAAIAAGEIAPSLNAVSDWMGDAFGNNLIVGSNARDLLNAGGGNDVLIGGGGDDFISGDRNYSLRRADDQAFDWRHVQWSFERVTTQTPEGLTSYDYSVVASADGVELLPRIVETLPGGADTIYAGTGNDGVFGGGGNDFIDGGAGQDVLFGEAGNDTVLGGADDDVLVGGGLNDVAGTDFLDGGDGNDTLTGGAAADVLYGGSGNDDLVGDDADENSGDDYLNGEVGNDRIWGAAGSDTLIGAEGDDQLFGDSIGTSAQHQGNDRLDGGAGNDVLNGSGGADVLMGGDGDDQLAGDLVQAAAATNNDDYLDGGAGNDVLFGWYGDDLIYGGDGADQLIGDEGSIAVQSHGNDYLDGGTGNDVLLGLGGVDRLFGGSGDDILDGDSSTIGAVGGDDALHGGEGVDDLYGRGGADSLFGDEGDDFLDGGEGNDIIVGGLGLDYMRGGAGDDMFIFDAEDFLVLSNTREVIDDTEGNNQIVFRSGLSVSNLAVLANADANSVTIATADGAYQLVVRGALSGFHGMITLADGTTLTFSQLVGGYYADAANASSEVSGAFLVGGTLADTIVGNGDNSTISGGKGNDNLAGGTSTTTYLFERGDGSDIITDASTFDASAGLNQNTLSFGYDIDLDQISLVVNAGDGGITVDLGNGDRVKLNSFSPSDVLGGPRTIDRFVFAGGDALTWQQLVGDRRLLITNTQGLASYGGTNLADEVVGAAIGETVNAGAGDDLINGGGGNDLLTGGAGSDTYLFGRTSGGDTINNYDTATGKIDRLQIAADIASSEIDFFKVGTSLLVRLRSSTNQVFVTDYFTTAGLDEIRFGDGTTYTAATIPWQNPPGNWISYRRGDGARTYAINDPADSIADSLHFGANVDPASVQLGSDSNGNLVIRFREPDGTLNYADRLTFTGAVTNPSLIQWGMSLNRGCDSNGV